MTAPPTASSTSTPTSTSTSTSARRPVGEVRATQAGPLGGAVLRPLQALALVLVLVFAVWIGQALTSPSAERAAVLRLGLVVALIALAVALNSYEAFVLGLVVLRPVLDWPKALGMDDNGLLGAGAAGLLTLVGILWFAAQSRAGRRRPLSALSSVLLVLVATMALSTAASLDVATSAPALARTVAAVVLLVTLEQLVRSRRGAERLLVAALCSAVLPLLVGLYQFATGDYARADAGVGRLTGTFVHPNSFGLYLALIITMAAALYRHTHGRSRLLLALLLVAASGELLLTYSRGGWFSLGVALLLVGALQVRKLLVLMPLAVGLALVLVPSVSARLADLDEVESEIGTPGNSLFWRFEQWGESLSLVDGRVFTGIGPGLVDVLTSRAPHNDAVRLYTEGGVLGLVAYLAFLVVLVALAVRTVRRAPAGLPRGAAVGFAGCAGAFVVNSMGANLITQVVILTYLFVFATAARAMASGAAGPDGAVEPSAQAPAAAR